MVSSTTWVCNWVILVKNGGEISLEFFLAVFISSYWGMEVQRRGFRMVRPFIGT
jgi:hypothetical protein